MGFFMSSDMTSVHLPSYQLPQLPQSIDKWIDNRLYNYSCNSSSRDASWLHYVYLHRNSVAKPVMNHPQFHHGRFMALGLPYVPLFWVNIPLCGVLPHLSFCLRSSLFTEAQPGTGKLSDLQGDQA